MSVKLENREQVECVSDYIDGQLGVWLESLVDRSPYVIPTIRSYVLSAKTFDDIDVPGIEKRLLAFVDDLLDVQKILDNYEHLITDSDELYDVEVWHPDKIVEVTDQMPYLEYQLSNAYGHVHIPRPRLSYANLPEPHLARDQIVEHLRDLGTALEGLYVTRYTILSIKIFPDGRALPQYNLTHKNWAAQDFLNDVEKEVQGDHQD